MERKEFPLFSQFVLRFIRLSLEGWRGNIRKSGIGSGNFARFVFSAGIVWFIRAYIIIREQSFLECKRNCVSIYSSENAAWELKSREGYSIGTWGIGDSKSHLIESHRCRNWIASYRDSFVTIHQPEDKKRRRKRRRIDLRQIRSSARISLSASFSRRKSIGIREIHRFDRASTRSEFIVDAISSSRRALREGEGSLPGNVYARSIIYDKLQPSNLLGGISRPAITRFSHREPIWRRQSLLATSFLSDTCHAASLLIASPAKPRRCYWLLPPLSWLRVEETSLSLSPLSRSCLISWVPLICPPVTYWHADRSFLDQASLDRNIVVLEEDGEKDCEFTRLVICNKSTFFSFLFQDLLMFLGILRK